MAGFSRQVAFTKKLGLFFVFLLLLPSLASAYIVTADLEIYGDDHAQFYINGNLGGQTGWDFDQPTNYSTADGTLDLNWFLPGNPLNLLAADNPPNTSGPQNLSYRLTVHYSDGTTAVAWSDPTTAKFIYIQWPLTPPPGWMNPGFNDSGWSAPFDFTPNDGSGQYYPMPDPSNVPWDYVPILSNSATTQPNPSGSQNLYRTYFNFPGSGINLSKSSNVTETATGQTLNYTLNIGTLNDTTSTITVYDTVPAGTTYVAGSANNGGTYNAGDNMVTWNFNLTGQVNFQYAYSDISSVISAPGWTSPASAVGLTTGAFGASFPSGVGNTGWFQVAPFNVVNPNQYIIAGVIFHSTVEDKGSSGVINPIMFNYSVDGTDNPYLAQGVDVERETFQNTSVDGYYDATADRSWTWADLNNLRVSYYDDITAPAGDTMSLDGLEVVIKYYLPSVVPFGFSALVTITANCPGPTTIDNTAMLQGVSLVATTSNDAQAALYCNTTNTNTPTITNTSIFTSTATPTITGSATATPTITTTATNTVTGSSTVTPSLTVTSSQTFTPSQTMTSTLTFTPVPSIYIYPNVFNPDKGQKLKFWGIPPASKVSIYTLTTELVWHSDLSPNNNLLLIWDGRNMQGQVVATGLYFYVLDMWDSPLQRRHIKKVGKIGILRGE